MPDKLLPVLFLIQGVMGGIDTVVNHELIVQLPKRPNAKWELALHSGRELVYCLLFLLVAWCAMSALTTVAAILLIGTELSISLTDEWIENSTRILPPAERLLHTCLTFNLGIIAALIIGSWKEHTRSDIFGSAPTLIHYGWISWALTCLAVASLIWAIRDLRAALLHQPGHPSKTSSDFI